MSSKQVTIGTQYYNEIGTTNKLPAAAATTEIQAKLNLLNHCNDKSDNKYRKMASSLKCAISGHGYFVRSKNRKQFSNLVFIISTIIIISLCPFNSDFEPSIGDRSIGKPPNSSSMTELENQMPQFTGNYRSLLEHTCREFVRLLGLAPGRYGKRTTIFMQAEAKVLSKMAKMWYIKKKIKKFSKKLKKHTIAVPVFTAIPIYEHAYYPPPHIAHVPAPIPMHHAAHHHAAAAAAAAASSYSPVVMSQVAAAAAMAAAAQQHQTNQQHLGSASNQQHQIAAYRLPAQAHQQQQQQQQQHQQQRHSHHQNLHHQAAHLTHHPPIFHHIAAANQIINAYAPSPPLYVDELGSLYGHYGNAYGRYDGGYQLW